MARTIIPVTSMNRRATVPNATETNADPVNNMFIVNDGATWIEVRNNNGAVSRSFTVEEPNLVDGDLLIADRTYTLTPSQTVKVGPFPRSLYGETLLIDIPVGQTDLRFTAYSLLVF
jgi:hypothetical protein